MLIESTPNGERKAAPCLSATKAQCPSSFPPAMKSKTLSAWCGPWRRSEHLRELIVVDDASTDRTAEILAGLGREFPLLRTVRLESLPAGWMGKSHAAAAGAETATGEWLLFTDADTEHLPGSLEAMLGRAREEKADLLSLSPGQQTVTWWEKSIIPYVFIELARMFPFEEVSDPASPQAAANGQYLLVRRSVYNEIGGFAAVRGEILDDVALARLVKQRGGRLVFCRARNGCARGCTRASATCGRAGARISICSMGESCGRCSGRQVPH